MSLIAAGMAYGSVPPVTVTVLDAGGKTAYKSATDANGAFATGKLRSGNYVVQFNAKGGAMKGDYGLVISAGKKKVAADSVAAEKFSAGGVAMRIEVGDGLNIAGQLTAGLRTMKDKNGVKMVWIPQKLGSNLPAHWAPADSAEAKEAQTQTSYSTKNLQDKQNAGISPSG